MAFCGKYIFKKCKKNSSILFTLFKNKFLFLNIKIAFYVYTVTVQCNITICQMIWNCGVRQNLGSLFCTLFKNIQSDFTNGTGRQNDM